MKIKWELNNRVKSLVSQGKIKQDDVIKRTQTHNFPPDACTIRMAKPNDPAPWVVLHIRGKSKIRTYTYGGGQTYECAETCRVSIASGGEDMMSSNGSLDEDLTWLDVHNLVTEVKGVMNY